MFTQAITTFSMRAMRTAVLDEALIAINNTHFNECVHPDVVKSAFQNLARKYVGQVDPNMTKAIADSRLRNASVGTFCIRRSSIGDSISLSIVNKAKKILHYRFDYKGNQGSGMETVESCFRDFAGFSLEETIYKTISEYDAALMVANATIDLSTYRQNNDVPLLILATQYSKNNEDETRVRPGGTGQVIQRHLGGALTRMHRNLTPTAEEIALFKRHIAPQSFIIITGHHSSSDEIADNLKITGTYITDSQPNDCPEDDLLKVEYTPEMYVSVLMQGANLSKGDHVHVLLYACHAARPNKEGMTLSREFAKAFAAFGINTTIIASTEIIGRLADIDRAAGDLPGAAIRLRAEPENIRVLKSTISEDNELVHVENAYNEAFVITPIGCGPKDELEEFFLAFFEQATSAVSTHSYADLMMYFLPHKKVESVHDKARVERAKQIFCHLTHEDKRQVLEIIKPVNQALYLYLSVMLNRPVSLNKSTVFAAPSTAVEMPEDNHHQLDDYRCETVPS